MSHAIHFKTSLFDVSNEKMNPVNLIYGISLLEWLKEELKGNVEITEPDAEDWGWYSELVYQGNNYHIGASAYFEEGDDPAEELEWVFQVEKNRRFKEKLFGKNKISATDSCFLFFKKLFENHPDIKNVQIG